MDTATVIEQWTQEEQAVRARLRPDNAPRPTINPATLTGLEILNAIFSGDLPKPPIGETLDFLPIRMAPGEAIFQGRPLQRHYNPLGSLGACLWVIKDQAGGGGMGVDLAVRTQDAAFGRGHLPARMDRSIRRS